MLTQAAASENSLKRLALATIATVSAFSSTKIRKRKPFNPMLGETYEFVSDKVRFIAEKVSHNPMQVTCFHQEGINYTVGSYNRPQPKFRANYGKGAVEIQQMGLFNIHLKQYDEHISVSKPKICAKNIIFGGLYIDLDGQVEAVNHKTNEKVVLQFHQKQSNAKNSYIEGKVYDAQGT